MENKDQDSWTIEFRVEKMTLEQYQELTKFLEKIKTTADVRYKEVSKKMPSQTDKSYL